MEGGEDEIDVGTGKRLICSYSMVSEREMEREMEMARKGEGRKRISLYLVTGGAWGGSDGDRPWRGSSQSAAVC